MIKEKLTMKIIKSMTLDDFRKITWVKLLKDHCEAITKKIKNMASNFFYQKTCFVII
jgi:hypothetical protein